MPQGFMVMAHCWAYQSVPGRWITDSAADMLPQRLHCTHHHIHSLPITQELVLSLPNCPLLDSLTDVPQQWTSVSNSTAEEHRERWAVTPKSSGCGTTAHSSFQQYTRRVITARCNILQVQKCVGQYALCFPGMAVTKSPPLTARRCEQSWQKGEERRGESEKPWSSQ